MRKPKKPMVGRTFGRLTVERVGSRKGNGFWTWHCRCECGNTAEVRGIQLRSGHTKSCGCLKRENTIAAVQKDPGHAGLTCVYANYRGAARRKNREFLLTREDFQRLTAMDCVYCGTPPTAISRAAAQGLSRSARIRSAYVYNGLDRVDSSKGYTLDNVVPCCKHCNMAKLSRDVGEYKEWIRRSYEHLFNTKIPQA